jgi:hypothetical protein
MTVKSLQKDHPVFAGAPEGHEVSFENFFLRAHRALLRKGGQKKDLSRPFEITTMFHFVISSGARNLSPAFSFFAGVRSTRTTSW